MKQSTSQYVCLSCLERLVNESNLELSKLLLIRYYYVSLAFKNKLF